MYLQIGRDRDVAWQNLLWRRSDLLQQKPTFFAISQQPLLVQQIGDGGATGNNSANISVVFFQYFIFLFGLISNLREFTVHATAIFLSTDENRGVGSWASVGCGVGGLFIHGGWNSIDVGGTIFFTFESSI